MLFVIEKINFEPYSHDLWSILSKGCYLFESSDFIIESLENYYDIKITSIEYCNVIEQTDCDGYINTIPKPACGISSTRNKTT